MDKYKLLITGKNNAIIDDCFKLMGDEFTILSTSERYEDMNKHLDVFTPNILVCALNGENREEISRFVELKRKLTRMEISFFIIGEKEDCEMFQKQAVYLVDEAFYKPIDAVTIRKNILEHMAEVERVREENRKIQEALEKIKEQERRKHVLIIDDDPLMLKLIKEYLHESYDVATAISGKIAYKFLETKKTDLILLDYEMPVENGPQVLENLREMENLADIPVLFLTGITDKDKIKQALMLKPQGYLLKPIDRDKLLGTIEKFIG